MQGPSSPSGLAVSWYINIARDGHSRRICRSVPNLSGTRLGYSGGLPARGAELLEGHVYFPRDRGLKTSAEGARHILADFSGVSQGIRVDTGTTFRIG